VTPAEILAALAEPAPAPGAYVLRDLSFEDYLRDPVACGSISSSGAKRLLPPHCPAAYRWYADNPQPPKKEYDLGHAAHELLLGTGSGLVVVDADSWRTTKAQDAKKAAYAAGRTPLLTKDMAEVEAMVAAVRAHPEAGPLLDPASGDSEQTLIWFDDDAGVWRRARLDRVLERGFGERVVIVDLKTTVRADPDSAGKAMAAFGYDQQAAWYLDAAAACGLDPVGPGAGGPDVYLLVMVEKSPPYLTAVYRLPEEVLQRGRVRNRKALAVYRRCMESGWWPGYNDDRTAWLDSPAWAARQHDDAAARGDYDVEDTP